MISRRVVLGTATAVLGLAALPLPPALAQSGPATTIQSFYATLLDVMQHGQALGFAGRRDKLAPVIKQDFDLPLMTRLMVGLSWSSFTPAQQQQLIAAFTNFSIATYANRFDDYSGERFEVDPRTTPTANGGVIVHTKLIKSDGEPVTIAYQMHDNTGKWQIVDVYLAGTVSELATRRSEFSSVIRRGGPEALVQLLQRKAVELSS